MSKSVKKLYERSHYIANIIIVTFVVVKCRNKFRNKIHWLWFDYRRFSTENNGISNVAYN